MYFAVEQMCLGNDELALTLHEDGRHFDGLPFLNSTATIRETIQRWTIPPPAGICLK